MTTMQRCTSAARSARSFRLRFGAPFLVAMGALAAGCALPSRDNPRDPVNLPPESLPTAELALSGGEVVAGGSCDATELITPASDAFPRSRCVVASAAGSTDPQGDIASYIFELGTSGSGDFSVYQDSASPTFTLLDLRFLPSAELAPFPETTVRVTVVDGNGGSSSAETSFKLSNSRPVAIPPPIRQVPTFGALWLRFDNGTKIGGPLDVRLDASASFDDEGDALTYCWREVDPDLPPLVPFGGACEQAVGACLNTDPSRPEVVVTVDPEAEASAQSETLYELQVCDGDVWSRPARGGIQRSLSPGWALDADYNDALVYDVVAEHHEIGAEIVGAPGLLFNAQSPAPLIVAGFDDPITPAAERNRIGLLVAGSAGQPSPVATLPPYSGFSPDIRLVVPATGVAPPSAFVVAGVGSAGFAVFAVTSGATLAATQGLVPDPPLPPISGQQIHGVWDPAEEIFWLASSFGSHVWGFQRTGAPPGTVAQVERIDIPPDEMGHPRGITGLARRPTQNAGQASSLIITHSANILVPGEGAPARTRIRDPQGVVIEADVEFTLPPDLGDIGLDLEADADLVSGPFFVNKNAAYYVMNGAGVAAVGLVPDDSGNPGGDFSLVIFGFAPFEGAVGSSGASHPVSNRLLFFIPGHQSLSWTTQRGSVGTLASTRKAREVWRDDARQRLWTWVPSEIDLADMLVSGAGTGVEAEVSRFPMPPQFGTSMPSLDFASGDMWATSTVPVGVIRYGTDGRAADVISGVSSGADGAGCENDELLGAPAFAVSDPASGHLWIVAVTDSAGGARTVFRADPFAARQVQSVAPEAGVCGKRLPDDETVLEAYSQPTIAGSTTSGALVLLLFKELSPFKLRRILPDGSEPFPGGVDIPGFIGATSSLAMSRDLVTGNICVAGRTGATQIGFGFYSHDLDTVLSAGTQTVGSGAKVAAVAAFNDECWISASGLSGNFLSLVRMGSAGPPPTTTFSQPVETMAPLINEDAFDPQKRRVWVSTPDSSEIHRVVISSTGGLVVEESFPTFGEVRLVLP